MSVVIAATAFLTAVASLRRTRRLQGIANWFLPESCEGYLRLSTRCLPLADYAIKTVTAGRLRFIYSATVIDVWSRRAVGWSIGEHMRANPCSARWI